MSEDQEITSVECTEISDIISTQEPIIHLTENGVVGFEVLCRLCANRSDHLIPIYSEEGISNDLADKMNLYLPVKVSKTDLLPLQCCFQCASTVLTWHELVIASVEADKRLRDVQAEVEKQLAEHAEEIDAENEAEAGPSQENEKIFVDERCTPQNIKDNIETIRKSFPCPECKKLFMTKLSLQRHLLIHRDERPFICDICGIPFREKGGLQRHISHVHLRKKDFACDVCKQKFASASTRNDHLRIHTKQRPFICDACGKCFSSKAGLFIHSKIHVDVFPFSCVICNKKFRRRQQLIVHSSIHSGEKPYHCKECGMSFRVKILLTKHLLTHSDSKPFCCDVCGIRYRQSRYLKKHMKVKHKNTV